MIPSSLELEKVLQSDPTIKNSLASMNSLIVPSDLTLQQAMTAGYPGMQSNAAGLFVATEEYVQFGGKIRKRLEKSFGAFADDIWFNRQLLVYAGKVLLEPERAGVKLFSETIGKATENVLRAIPCKNFELIGFNELDIPFCKVISRGRLIEFLKQFNEDEKISYIGVPKEKKCFSIVFEGWGTSEFKDSDFFYLVESNSPNELIGEHVEYLIQSSISLFRYFLNPQNIPNHPFDFYYPWPGSIEINPIYGLIDWYKVVSVRDGEILKGGSKVKHHYYITKKQLEKYHKQVDIKIIESLRSPIPNSIGSAVANSLYWQSKARQSENRAEKVVLFFTALEGLLASRASVTPVTETIARFTGCLSTDDIAQREAIASEIKGLYKSRSLIVHQGVVSSHFTTAREIQIIVEAITRKILFNTDLTKSLNDLHSCLKTASYGAKLDIASISPDTPPDPETR